MRYQVFQSHGDHRDASSSRVSGMALSRSLYRGRQDASDKRMLMVRLRPQTVIVGSAIKRQKAQTASETACLWIIDRAVRKFSRSDQIRFFPFPGIMLAREFSIQAPTIKTPLAVSQMSLILIFGIVILSMYCYLLLKSKQFLLGSVPSQLRHRPSPSPLSPLCIESPRSSVPLSPRSC